MPYLLGTAPNQVPTNSDLGKLAFMDEVNSVSNNPWMNTDISDVKPSLLLDFANSKTLDPRITYSRASTATYYDGKTTAVAEQNLISYSQDFDNAWWGKNNSATVTANTVAAPDGTVTADTLTFAADAASRLERVVLSSVTGTYTFSVWLMVPSGTFDVRIRAGAGTTTTVTATTTWQRFTVTETLSAANSTPVIMNNASASAGTVYVWGAQLEQRSAVSSYTPTSGTTITNYIPALQTAAAGIPRFDHDPITGESKGFLVEEQRSNLLTYSDDFSNAAWTKSNITNVVNVVVAPDGTLSADKVILDSGIAVNTGSLKQTTSKTASATTYTVSVYAKAGGFDRVKLYCRDASMSSNSAQVTVSLVDGSISGAATALGTFTSASSTVLNVGNGWYRVSLTFTTGTETSIWGGGVLLADSVKTTGDGFSGIYIWGAQLEAGSFPTSYIPTTSAQVTRSADTASMTGTNFSSWFNQSEGSFYIDQSQIQPSSARASSPYLWCVVENGNNRLCLRASGDGSGTAPSYVVGNMITNTTITATSVTAQKISTNYNLTSASLTSDGVSTQTVSTGYLYQSNTSIGIGCANGGGNQMTGWIKKFAYFPKRLSNNELQEMTE